MITTVVVGCLLLLFGAVVFRGAPYVPTHKAAIEYALDQLPLKKGSVIVDLGSGDGSVLLRAARRGWHAVGYEINPILAFVTWLRCLHVRQQVKVYMRDFWLATLPPDASVVFVFLARPYMRKLKRKLDHDMQQRTQPLYVVSYGFAIPGILPKHVGHGLYIYELKP